MHSFNQKHVAEFKYRLQAFTDSKIGSFLSHLSNTMYTTTPSLYECLNRISALVAEIFADGLNDSGVLPSFCSVDASDLWLGAAGRWETAERSIVAEVGNPGREGV